MPSIMDAWCRLFGYEGCKAVSTFEAIILALITLVAVSVAASLLVGFIMAARE